MYIDKKVLDKDDYFEILRDSLSPQNGSIEDYLFSLYNDKKQANHKFQENIKEQIDIVINWFKRDLKNFRHKEVVESDDDVKFIIGIKQVFFDINEKIKVSSSYENIITSKKALEAAFTNFKRLVEGENGLISNKNSSVKLKWVLQKNQLYHVLRQLKEDYKAIDMPYTEIADFIKQNVAGFSETSKDTILKELRKNLNDTNNFPRNKRIKIKLD